MTREFTKLKKKVLRFLANNRRPIVQTPEPILGSFAPHSLYDRIGERADFFIHAGYRVRNDNQLFDDTDNSDDWQAEVYEFAREIAERDGLGKILDIGCGSGYKLLKYLGDKDTYGAELPRAYEYLKRKYPDRQWRLSDFQSIEIDVDLVIASDVIEHLPNPDELLTYIQRLQPKQIVLSTPDRNLLLCGRHDGPPINPAHVREWSYFEFRRYIEEFFEIEEHFISFPAQATQCLLCKPKSA